MQEEVGMILKGVVGIVVPHNGDLPPARLEPFCADDFVVEVAVFHDISFLSHVLEILVYLGRPRVVLRPVRLPRPAVLVTYTRNVASTARVSVLEPSPAKVTVLLYIQVAKGPWSAAAKTSDDNQGKDGITVP